MDPLLNPAPASLDTRPELINISEFSTFTPIDYDNDKTNNMITNTTINSNSFMNMNLSEIFDKVINILPFMYNNFYEINLETKLKYQNKKICQK